VEYLIKASGGALSRAIVLTVQWRRTAIVAAVIALPQPGNQSADLPSIQRMGIDPAGKFTMGAIRQSCPGGMLESDCRRVQLYPDQ